MGGVRGGGRDDGGGGGGGVGGKGGARGGEGLSLSLCRMYLYYLLNY